MTSFADPCGRIRHRYLGSWIVEVEETGEVPGNVLRLERILRMESRIQCGRRHPDIKRMEGRDE